MAGINSGIKDPKEKCMQWLEESESQFSATDDIISESGNSTAFTSSVDDFDLNSISDDVSNLNINNIQTNDHLKILSKNANVSDVNQTEILQNVFHGNTVQSFGNIQIKNSNKVHIGNVTYVTGPIHIIHTTGNNFGTVQQLSNSSTTSSDKTFNESKTSSQPSQPEGEEREEKNKDELFIGAVAKSMDTRVLKIIDRRTWLAQPALSFETLTTPVSYVVISHTATESSDTQAGMIYMVRHVQCYHIESNKWHDIAYSFLVGDDGNVYEGRGWNRVGAHTYGYNARAIGISFVGCFMNILPAQIALNACKLLIAKGVREGYITPDYKLLAHCQCSVTESPGKMLFEEIKTWDHWSPDI